MKLNARATLEQMKHARKLGIPFDTGTTQGELHLLINTKARKKIPPPTEMQIRIAEKFGLDFKKAGMSQHYLGDLIVDTLLEHFHEEDVIRYEDHIYTIKSIREARDTWVVNLKSHETGAIQRRSISTIALAEHLQQ